MSRQRNIFVVLSIAAAFSTGCATLDNWRTSFDDKRASKAPALSDATPRATPIRQHIATVASVDQQAQTIRLTHGPIVRVTPSTKVHVGKDGAPLALRDLRPGDKLIFNVAADGTSSGASRTRRTVSTDADASGSALPRDVGGLATPGEVLEVMVFRPAR